MGWPRVFRDAITGRFVSKKEADRRPRTTVSEKRPSRAERDSGVQAVKAFIERRTPKR